MERREKKEKVNEEMKEEEKVLNFHCKEENKNESNLLEDEKFSKDFSFYLKEKVDFWKLGQIYPEFKKFLFQKRNGTFSIDFHNNEAVHQLTKTLLFHYFGLKVEFPLGKQFVKKNFFLLFYFISLLDSLCPMITVRFNYILWINELLENSQFVEKDWENNWRSSNIKGIDIGTGASCIYPLLGSTVNKNWNFLAIDINARSVQYAKHNVLSNKLQDRIQVIKNASSKGILTDILQQDSFKDEKFNFCMCNPPFFSSLEEAEFSCSNYVKPPNTVRSASQNELITEGGEIQFVSQMIEESELLKYRIIWFTSMIGKKSDLKPLKNIIKSKNINYHLTEFNQGYTHRWGIAWSYICKSSLVCLFIFFNLCLHFLN